MKKFYMCKRIGGGVPTKEHPTVEEAVKEASRICVKEKSPVIVLEAIKIIDLPKPDVIVEDIDG